MILLLGMIFSRLNIFSTIPTFRQGQLYQLGLEAKDMAAMALGETKGGDSKSMERRKMVNTDIATPKQPCVTFSGAAAADSLSAKVLDGHMGPLPPTAFALLRARTSHESYKNAWFLICERFAVRRPPGLVEHSSSSERVACA